MTKQEEKARFAEFLASIPRDSYLWPILSAIQNEVNEAIANDFGFIDFSAQMEAQREHIATVATLQTKIAELKGECRKLDTERARIACGIDQLRSEARSLAKLAMA